MNTKNDILNAEKDEIIFSAIEGIEFNGESFDFESLEEELENKLISEFEDLDMLKEELKAVEDPDKLGKVILDEVWKQFGNQIGLDMTNETLIQKYDREHPESYADIKNSIMQDPAYKEAKRVAEEA